MLQLASSTRPLGAGPRWLMAQLMLSVSHRRRKKCLCLAAYTCIPSCLHWKLFHSPPPIQLILLKFCLDLINVIPVHTAARSVLCYIGFPLDFKVQPTTYRITSLDLGGNFTELMVERFVTRYFTDLQCPPSVWLHIFICIWKKNMLEILRPCAYAGVRGNALKLTKWLD